jgi:hypothetical protein
VSSFRREPGAVVETDRLFLEEILPETSPRMILGTEVEDIRRTVIFWGRASTFRRLSFRLRASLYNTYIEMLLCFCSFHLCNLFVTIQPFRKRFHPWNKIFAKMRICGAHYITELQKILTSHSVLYCSGKFATGHPEIQNISISSQSRNRHLPDSAVARNAGQQCGPVFHSPRRHSLNRSSVLRYLLYLLRLVFVRKPPK